MPRRLFFCHIPKTAGGSLSRSIRGLFAKSNVIDFENSSLLFRVSDRELAEARLLTGHAGANLAHRLPPDTLTMTVLRDPIKRVLSVYNFFLAHGVIEDGLLNFLVNGGNRWAVNNTMSWQLAHDHSQSGRRDEPMRDWSDDQLQAAAFDALSKINIIGVAEELDQVIERLEAIYEQPLEPLGRVNEVKRAVVEPSEEELAFIRKSNVIDQAVYDEAVRIKDAIWERTRQLVIAGERTNHFV